MTKSHEEWVLTGKGISGGFAVGTTYVYRDILTRSLDPFAISRQQLEEEYSRIESAIEAVVQDLNQLAGRMEEDFTPEYSDLFTAQALLLRDPSLLKRLRREMENELVNAEQVVKTVFRRVERAFKEKESEEMALPGDDIAELKNRLLKELLGIETHILENIPQGSILIAQRLFPSDTVHLSRKSTLGIVTESGGKNSHTALLTREMGIPYISGINSIFSRIQAGQQIALDGRKGTVVINPVSATLKDYKAKKERLHRKQTCREVSGEVATTKSGISVRVMANIGFREDTELAIQNGADGIGLYRIEHLYLSQKTVPTDDIIFQNIERVLTSAGDKEISIRLLDIGADKNFPFLNLSSGDNPLLGLRGIRLLKTYPEILIAQLKAFLQLSRHRDIRILVPMITLADEMRWVRKMLEQQAEDVGVEKLPKLGAMLETPASVLNLEQILPHSDFVSVGTNDLTQYTMVADREDIKVEEYYNDRHPAVFSLLKLIMESCSDIPLSICGELAGNQAAIPDLIDLGYRILSVPPPLVAETKDFIRAL